MSSVARAVSCASSLTSLATTAKPLPTSPARAASIVAFSASRLVCSAMLEMTLTTSPISRDESPSRLDGHVRRLRGGHRPVGHLRGLAGALRDLADRGAHLLGAGGDGLHAARDLLGGDGDDVGLGGGLLRVAGDPVRRLPTRSLVAASSAALRDTAAMASPMRASAGLAYWPQLAEAVLRGGVEPLGQVAVGDGGEHGDRVGHRAGDAAGDPPGDDDGERGGQAAAEHHDEEEAVGDAPGLGALGLVLGLLEVDQHVDRGEPVGEQRRDLAS